MSVPKSRQRWNRKGSQGKFYLLLLDCELIGISASCLLTLVETKIWIFSITVKVSQFEIEVGGGSYGRVKRAPWSITWSEIKQESVCMNAHVLFCGYIVSKGSNFVSILSKGIRFEEAELLTAG